MDNKNMKKKTKKQQKANISSGILFIGDAEYFSQSLHPDVTHKLPNPLENFPAVAEKVSSSDTSTIDFPNGIEGFGMIVQTHLTGGNFKVKKTVDKVTGKIKKITVEFI